MKSTFLRWTCVFLLLACGVSLVGAWQWRAREALREWDPERSRTANLPIPVRTVVVDERDVEETIGGTAVTLPNQSAAIAIPLNSSTVAQRLVKEVAFQAGSAVKRGDVLFQFESALFDQLVRHRSALLSKAQQELETMVNLKNHKAASGLQVKESEVAVETAQLELNLAKADLDLCVVESPIDGVVESVSVVPEMHVGSESVLAVVHQLDPILVQMDFPMERLDSLRVDQTAEVTLDAFPQEKFQGRVTRILPVVSTKTRVLPVIVEVANPENRIRAGISGFVRIQSDKAAVPTVPSVAVIKKQNRAMVFCVEDSRARIREVHPGPVFEAGRVAILSGLNRGDEVIIYGQDAVKENDLVNVNWQQWAQRQ
jgi:membrane fusion protein, multidrug efflux system